MAGKRASKTRKQSPAQAKASTSRKPNLPSYREMIQDAITGLISSAGLTKCEISRYIFSNYYIPDERKASRNIDSALKTELKSGFIVKSKGKFQLGDAKPLVANTKAPNPHGACKGGKGAGKLKTGSSLSKKATRKSDRKQINKKSETAKSDGEKRIKKRQESAKVNVEETTTTPDNARGNIIVAPESWQESTSVECVSESPDIIAEDHGSFVVKIPGDEKDCYVTHMDSTSDGRVIVMDSNNQNLKVFDKEKNFVASYKFATTPTAMAVLNDVEILVSVYNTTPAMISFGTSLHILGLHGEDMSITHTIPWNEVNIRAVACYENKIFVSGSHTRGFAPPFVALIDRYAKVYWSNDVVERYSSPFHLSCFVEDNKLAIIMSHSCNSVITIYNSETGDIVKHTMHDGKGTSHASFAYGKGHLFICFNNNREIDVLPSSSRIDYRETLFCLMAYPLNIHFDEYSCELLVSRIVAHSNSVACFKIRE